MFTMRALRGTYKQIGQKIGLSEVFLGSLATVCMFGMSVGSFIGSKERQNDLVSSGCLLFVYSK